MLKVSGLEKSHIEPISAKCRRDQLPYHEYPFLADNQLSDYFRSKTIKSLNHKDSFALVAASGTTFSGMIACTKDDFDSEIFGFPCYRVTDLLVFSDEINAAGHIVDKLVLALEEELVSVSRPVYLSVSLNNNTRHVDYLFNGLTRNRYYYIHTLLTFFNQNRHFDVRSFYPEVGINIRVAVPNDAEQVADLAQKSFKFSRFHMDPFLDNDKASLLLKASAKNSILHGFVDVMFVAEIQNQIVGYYSAKKRKIEEFSKTIGDPVISAVSYEHRGMGIFSKLDDYILNWYTDNTDFAELGTYLVNSPVHKTWIKKGLNLVRGVHQFSKFIE